MGRRQILAALGWLATAVVATLVGLGAIRLVGASIIGTPGGVRSQEEVERALASPRPVSVDPTAGPTPTDPPAATAGPTSATGPTSTAESARPGVRKGFRTVGGSAVAECGPAGVRLVSWAPAQGYRVRDVDRGPDDDVEVKFTGPDGEHELKVRCVAAEPVAVDRD